MTTLDRLEKFVTFCECGTLLKTAEVLNISQPSLSRAMAELERDLDVKLFIRTKNSLTLSKCGQALLPLAKKIIKDVECLSSRLKEVDGTFSLMKLASCAPVPLWDIEPMIKEIDPKAITKSELLHNDKELIDGLKERHYDIIVTHEDPKDDELYTFPYRDERLSLLVPKDHPLAKHPVLELKDLDDMNILLLTEIGFWYELAKERLHNVHFLYMDDRNAFMDVVGLSSFPSFTTNAYVQDEVKESVVIPLDDDFAYAIYYVSVLKEELPHYLKLLRSLKERFTIKG